MANDELIAIRKLPEDTADTITQEIKKAQGIARYLQQLLKRHRGSPSLDFISTLGGFIEPIDVTVGAADPELPLGGAFIVGSLLGLRVVRACVARADLEPLIATAISTLPISNLSGNETKPVMRQRLVNDVLDFGMEGYEVVSPIFGQALAGWDSELYDDDITKHYFLHCGMGYPVALMQGVREQNKQILAARYFDWSAALGELS